MNITYRNDITISEYNKLRVSASWDAVSERQAQAGICRSPFMIAAYDGEEAVGMARLLHDGGFQAFIVDVVVLPEYQRMGIGKEMINSILAYIYSHLDEGEIIYVGLMSAKGKEEFYEQFGFTQRPNDSLGSGMTQKITRIK